MSTAYFRLNQPIQQVETQGLRWPSQILWFVLAALVVLSRRPDALLHPQFFAEDGTYWYAEAYNAGWLPSLLVPHAGYLQTFPRLAAALSLLVPLLYAPLLLNGIAIAVQVLPVTLLLSSRLANWASFPMRAALAAAYLVLPNSFEIDAVVTNAQWHLALLAALVVLALPPTNKLWRVFDFVIVLLSGLTGPFCLALLPIALVIWWKRRGASRLLLAALLSLCSALQIFTLASFGAARSRAPLGATPQLFLRMLAGDVFLGALLGRNHLALSASRWLLLPVELLSIALLAYCFWKSRLEFKLFLLYAFALYFAALRNPLISDTQPQWVVLAGAPGLRYWFFPMLAFVWAAILCLGRRNAQPARLLAACALVLMLVGIDRDWRYPAFTDHHFPEYVSQFASLPPGSLLTIPLFPEGWTMQLNKHAGGACSVLPDGFVDDPVDHASIRNSLTVRGWVFSTVPLARINVLLDGRPIQSLLPDAPRPDVDKVHPGGVIQNKGWQRTLDTSQLTPGPHLVQIEAQLPNGCTTLLGVRNIIETR